MYHNSDTKLEVKLTCKLGMLGIEIFGILIVGSDIEGIETRGMWTDDGISM